jgi:Fe-S cluster assembly protein SufD
VVICSLSQATKTYGSFLNNRWTKILKEEPDCFAALNGAMHGEGVFIYLPPNIAAPTPIQILHLVGSGQTPTISSPKLHVYAGKHAQAQFVSTVAVTSETPFWINQLHDFVIEDGACMTYYAVSQLPSTGIHFEAVRAHLKRDGKFTSINITQGSQASRQDYRVCLQGENAEASLYGLWMLDEQKHSHAHVFMEHAAPNCRSSQLFKGVLDGASRSSFEGKIYVHPEAQKTDAFQLNNHLLLNDHAMANSKPNLEIFADDVKASHGSTVGQIDQEHLFYLKTRGIDERTAKTLLIQGFNRAIIDLIAIPSVRERY